MAAEACTSCIDARWASKRGRWVPCVRCRVSGAAEGAVAPLFVAGGFGELGVLRLVLEGAREHLVEPLERSRVAHRGGGDGLLHVVVARDERGVHLPHAPGAVVGSRGLALRAAAPAREPGVAARGGREELAEGVGCDRGGGAP